jgi:hypothetical protein
MLATLNIVHRPFVDEVTSEGHVPNFQTYLEMINMDVERAAPTIVQRR